MSDEEKYQKMRALNRAAVARYKAAHPERVKASRSKSNKAWRAKNPEKARANAIRWAKANPEKARISQRLAVRKWERNNPEKKRQYHRNWVAKNREHHNARERHRHATDHSFRLGKNLRSRMRNAIRCAGSKKSDRAELLIGCDVIFLMGYLAARFKPCMTWENYGRVWEIDHIIPCSSYDLTDPSHQRSCFHYTNLQPLLVSENRRKYNFNPQHTKILCP